MRTLGRFQSASKPGRHFFRWALVCAILMPPSDSHSDFHRAVPHLGTRFVGQLSTAICLIVWPGYWPRPLSLETQTEGLLFCSSLPLLLSKGCAVQPTRLVCFYPLG